MEREKRTHQKIYRPGKTREDHMPVDKRPRVQKAKERAERMKQK